MVLHNQDILRPNRNIRSILDLQQHRAALQALQVVPLADGNVDDRATGNHVDGIGEPALSVVKVLLEMPPQTHHRLGRVPMPMDGQHRPRLDGVQHPLGTIGR